MTSGSKPRRTVCACALLGLREATPMLIKTAVILVALIVICATWPSSPRTAQIACFPNNSGRLTCLHG